MTATQPKRDEAPIDRRSQALERRQILMGFAAAGALAGVGVWALGRTMSATRAAKTDSDRLAALIDDVIVADETTALRIARDPLLAGVPADQVLAAAFLMPLWTKGDTSDIHVMAAVPAISRLMATTDESVGPKRFLPVLWAVSEALAWSSKARVVPPPLPSADGLWKECARPRPDPHVAIWASQAQRMLAQLPEHRALILSSVRDYAQRHAAPDEANTDVADARAGASATERFEALALLCVEARLTDATDSGLGVHQTTLLDALWRLHDQGVPTSSDAVRWLTNNRPHARLDVPVAELTPTDGDAFALAVDDPVAGYRAALSAVTHDENAFLGRARELLMTRGHDAHDFKYWDAVVSIGERLHGDLRTRWLAALVAARVNRSTSRWARHDEALALLERRDG